MSSYSRPRASDWIAGVAASTVLGLVFLGLGGRIGMRVIAFELGQTPAFSVGGSLMVVFLGAASGAAIGAIFLLGRTLFPRSRVGRVTFFWLVVGAIVLRGLNPVDRLRVVVLVPLFVIHGALLFAYWCRVRMRQAGAAAV